MIRRFPTILFVLVVVVWTSSAVALSDSHHQAADFEIPQSVTLYPPHDKFTGKYDESRACFNFKLGMNKLTASIDWHLGYGFLSIAHEDWLQAGAGRADERSVMKELGAHAWSDSFDVPVLEPLRELKEGEKRIVTIDSSGDHHREWANSTTQFAKAKVGRMYLLHVKDERSDFYVLFRVDQLEQGEQCTISWKRIPAPEGKNH